MQQGSVDHRACAGRSRHPRLLHAQGFNLPAEGTWFWVEGVIDAFFYIDLLLNFFVAFEVGTAVSPSRPNRPHGLRVRRIPTAHAPPAAQSCEPFRYACQDPVTGEVIADQKRIAARYLKVPSAGWTEQWRVSRLLGSSKRSSRVLCSQLPLARASDQAASPDVCGLLFCCQIPNKAHTPHPPSGLVRCRPAGHLSCGLHRARRRGDLAVLAARQLPVGSNGGKRHQRHPAVAHCSCFQVRPQRVGGGWQE